MGYFMSLLLTTSGKGKANLYLELPQKKVAKLLSRSAESQLQVLKFFGSSWNINKLSMLLIAVCYFLYEANVFFINSFVNLIGDFYELCLFSVVSDSFLILFCSFFESQVGYISATWIDLDEKRVTSLGFYPQWMCAMFAQLCVSSDWRAAAVITEKSHLAKPTEYLIVSRLFHRHFIR